MKADLYFQWQFGMVLNYNNITTVILENNVKTSLFRMEAYVIALCMSDGQKDEILGPENMTVNN